MPPCPLVCSAGFRAKTLCTLYWLYPSPLSTLNWRASICCFLCALRVQAAGSVSLRGAEVAHLLSAYSLPPTLAKSSGAAQMAKCFKSTAAALPRGPWSESLHQHGGLQLSVIPLPGSSALCWLLDFHPVGMHCSADIFQHTFKRTCGV